MAVITVPFIKEHLIKVTSYCYHSVNVITMGLSQSDHIKKCVLKNLQILSFFNKNKSPKHIEGLKLFSIFFKGNVSRQKITVKICKKTFFSKKEAHLTWTEPSLSSLTASRPVTRWVKLRWVLSYPISLINKGSDFQLLFLCIIMSISELETLHYLGYQKQPWFGSPVSKNTCDFTCVNVKLQN